MWRKPLTRQWKDLSNESTWRCSSEEALYTRTSIFPVDSNEKSPCVLCTSAYFTRNFTINNLPPLVSSAWCGPHLVPLLRLCDQKSWKSFLPYRRFLESYKVKDYASTELLTCRRLLCWTVIGCHSLPSVIGWRLLSLLSTVVMLNCDWLSFVAIWWVVIGCYCCRSWICCGGRSKRDGCGSGTRHEALLSDANDNDLVSVDVVVVNT